MRDRTTFPALRGSRRAHESLRLMVSLDRPVLFDFFQLIYHFIVWIGLATKWTGLAAALLTDIVLAYRLFDRLLFGLVKLSYALTFISGLERWGCLVLMADSFLTVPDLTDNLLALTLGRRLRNLHICLFRIIVLLNKALKPLILGILLRLSEFNRHLVLVLLLVLTNRGRVLTRCCTNLRLTTTEIRYVHDGVDRALVLSLLVKLTAHQHLLLLLILKLHLHLYLLFVLL